MSIIFSLIVILLLSNNDYLKIFVIEEKQTKTRTKLYIDLTVCLAAFMFVGTMVQYLIYTFILEPLNLDVFLLLIMITISVGFSILTECLLKKNEKESLIVFNKYKLAVLSFLGFIFLSKMSGTLFTSIILTFLSLVAFFIVGLILIVLGEIISPKIKLDDSMSTLLILGAIFLMTLSII